MATMTIPATYINWVAKPLKVIDKVPTKTFIMIEYNDEVKEKEMSLAEYLKSDEYKNDEWKVFDDPEDFLLELKKYKN